MKMLHYIIFIMNINEVKPYFIQNQDKLKCVNCKFFIPYKNECSNFGDVDIITNEYSYEEELM